MNRMPIWNETGSNFSSFSHWLEGNRTVNVGWSSRTLAPNRLPPWLYSARPILERVQLASDDLDFDVEKEPAASGAIHANFISSSASARENQVNRRRLEELERDFTAALLLALRQESVVPGVVGQADRLVARGLEQNRSATLEWLNAIYLRHFDKPSIAADVLLLVGRLPYETAAPFGVTMALGGLNHKNAAVQEAAIRAFERWANAESVHILKQVTFNTEWIRDYANDVISDLESA